MTEGAAVTGKCACGAVRFRLAPPLREIVACHCESCRRQSGHFVAATRLARDQLTIEAGEDRLTEWRATDDAVRRFCALCGSLLFWERPGSGHVSVFAGALDQPTGLRLDRHICCAEKGDYYEIEDGVSAFPGRDTP